MKNLIFLPLEDLDALENAEDIREATLALKEIEEQGAIPLAKHLNSECT